MLKLQFGILIFGSEAVLEVESSSLSDHSIVVDIGQCLSQSKHELRLCEERMEGQEDVVSGRVEEDVRVGGRERWRSV